MELGIDSFAIFTPDASVPARVSASERLANLIDEIVLADEVGLDVFGVGEHHRAEFLDAAPTIILAAAAVRTQRIRLTSAVTVLSAADPVRVFTEFATIDLLSKGRAEIVAGRGSFTEAFPLFGYELADYDELYSEKLDLLLRLRAKNPITWSGTFRAPLNNQDVSPRPYQDELPIWIGVGGTPASFARAGALGIPLMIAIIGGEPRQFRPLVDLYREAGRRAGHSPERLRVGVHTIGFVADSDQEAADVFFPVYSKLFTEVGKERGWAPTTRATFDRLRAPSGALVVGGPQTVADKIARINDDLGGVVRLTIQMTLGSLAHERMRRAIELLGTVSPLVRETEAASLDRA